MDAPNESHQVQTSGLTQGVVAQDLNAHIDRVFQDRYTCRAYDSNKKISEQDWYSIIHAGWRSPSSMGMEPWSFVRITDSKLREELLTYLWGAQDRCEGASDLLLVLGRSMNDIRPESDYIHNLFVGVQGLSEENIPALRKKITKFVGEDAGTHWEAPIVEKWVQQQVYIAVGNMMTVASILGIDSTPIEGFNKEQTTDFLVKRGIIDPNHERIACFIAFGYASRPGKTKIRRPLGQVYREV